MSNIHLCMKTENKENKREHGGVYTHTPRFKYMKYIEQEEVINKMKIKINTKNIEEIKV